MKDRQEEARKILTRYHANDVPDHPLVELELREMIASLRDEPPVTEWRSFFDLRQLVKTRGRRYRLGLNVVRNLWELCLSGLQIDALLNRG